MRRWRGRDTAGPCTGLWAVALLGLLWAVPVNAQDGQPVAEPQVDMAEMMARMREFTAPGEAHTLLERFIGDWDTALQVSMAAGGAASPEQGTATFSWLMEGRWLSHESRGAMMGMPFESFGILGYDRFKKSYVSVFVGTLDTAMLTAEGDMDPGGKALISYGTMDEYLTGEHDKMVKYVWRFVDDDTMVFEIHDLPIGEENTKVVQITYKRRVAAS